MTRRSAARGGGGSGGGSGGGRGGAEAAVAPSDFKNTQDAIISAQNFSEALAAVEAFCDPHHSHDAKEISDLLAILCQKPRKAEERFAPFSCNARSREIKDSPIISAISNLVESSRLDSFYAAKIIQSLSKLGCDYRDFEDVKSPALYNLIGLINQTSSTLPPAACASILNSFARLGMTVNNYPRKEGLAHPQMNGLLRRLANRTHLSGITRLSNPDQQAFALNSLAKLEMFDEMTEPLRVSSTITQPEAAFAALQALMICDLSHETPTCFPKEEVEALCTKFPQLGEGGTISRAQRKVAQELHDAGYSVDEEFPIYRLGERTIRSIDLAAQHEGKTHFVEVDGPSHFCGVDGRIQNGATILRDRLNREAIARRDVRGFYGIIPTHGLERARDLEANTQPVAKSAWVEAAEEGGVAEQKATETIAESATKAAGGGASGEATVAAPKAIDINQRIIEKTFTLDENRCLTQVSKHITNLLDLEIKIGEKTILQTALEKKWFKVASALLLAGAEIPKELRGDDNKTGLLELANSNTNLAYLMLQNHLATEEEIFINPLELIQSAIRDGNVGLVAMLIERNQAAETHFLDDGEILMQAAIKSPNDDVIELVINETARLNEEKASGAGASQETASAKKPKRKRGAKKGEPAPTVNIPEIKDAISSLIINNNPIMAEALIAKYSPHLKDDPAWLRDVLFLSSWFNHPNLVCLLVEDCGANPKEMRDGVTPLFTAAQNGHLEIVKYLIKKCGVDVNATMEDGATPLHIAAQFGRLEVVRCLVEECRANVDVEAKDGSTPLHPAAHNGYLEIVKFLVEECGADVGATLINGSTPLYLAAKNGHPEVVRYLAKECRADVDVVAKDGSTPLHIAAQEDYPEVVRCLVESGADVEKKMPKSGSTPLRIAVQNGRLEVVRCLVKECGANVEAAGKDGTTPLHIAAYHNYPEVAKCLVRECGANVEAMATDKLTPLHIAAQMGHLNVAKCLVEECGANVSATATGGATPLHIAIHNRHEEVTKYLRVISRRPSSAPSGASTKSTSGQKGRT